MTHDIHWYSPEPLWSKRLENGVRGRLKEPALLRFATDDFMDALQEELDRGAENFNDLIAGTETHRKEHEIVPPPETISLYQPAHERYYLVTASLVCRERGLPDRTVDTANEENVSFVLRRIEGESETEYGWFGEGKGWHPVEKTAPGKIPVEENGEREEIREERLPMFPQTYEPNMPLERMKGSRRLWAGLIPVAKRETYAATSVKRSKDGDVPPVPEDDLDDKTRSLSDPRKTKLDTQVIGAFTELRKKLEADSENESSENESPSLSAGDVRDPLLFAWLDLWEFLKEHLSDVARHIANPKSDFDLESGDRNVLGKLHAIEGFPEKLKKALGEKATDILKTVADKAETIKTGKLDNVLPADKLQKKGDEENGGQLARGELATALAPLSSTDNNKKPEIQTAINSALEPLEKSEQLPQELQPPITEGPPDDESGGWTYVVRCLYERPKCHPFRATVVSEPSRRFRLASFFDAEAPARSMNITLPGASVADFRKSSQGVTMHFTKELRKQAQRVQNITLEELDKGNIGSAPKVKIGMICSLSIPIITICALILLIIMVSVLNIIFWWLPFFKICFPLPSGDES